MIELSDEDIRRRLTDIEDSTVERKTASDYRDCLKTAVAFSNSLPADDPGIIFVGVYDDGRVQDGQNLEDLQKNVSKELSKVYPPIYSQMKVLKDGNDKQFVAVIVRGSDDRPHFAGPSYIRDGTQTKEASAEQFTRLIAERNSKVREILKYKGKQARVRSWEDRASFGGITLNKGGSEVYTVVDCNQHFVTIAKGEKNDSISLSRIEIAHDYELQCIRLEVPSL